MRKLLRIHIIFRESCIEDYLILKNIIGDENNWVTAEELLQNSIILADDSYNVYSLDWKWFESSNDTEIGKNIEANYKLNISFFAERY